MLPCGITCFFLIFFCSNQFQRVCWFAFSRMRHFLKETDFTREEIAGVFATAAAMKRDRGRCSSAQPLARQSWGLLFFKKSTRTRVSFQVGVHELGGQPVMLNADELQLSRGESAADTARVLSRYLHGLVLRCYSHSLLEEFAQVGSVPVVNALSDYLHPCQIYTDFFTLAERWSGGNPDRYLESLKGRKIAFLGDTACNMANSFILGGALLGVEVVLAGPEDYEPGGEIRTQLKSDGLAPTWSFTTDPVAAVRGADMVYTDVWVSMGMEAEKAERLRQMQPYQVNTGLMRAAKPEALFMHCLPAHAGEEVAQEVLDSPASIIFDQAENRLHTQKAILAHLAS
ncbi:MAG: ornithine carbamoyltransferase [Puniceicoccales bacterium]|jgi:ornithine carbamoyltransferase|nr:ornithine carbamoyltransferase [Puniceicoccales bacterium]